MMYHNKSNNEKILGMRVDTTNYEDATNQIIKWAVSGETRYVCAANVHMVMETNNDVNLQKIVNQADLVTPDGMPLVWILRRLGHPLDDRVYGPTLMERVLKTAAAIGIPVGFYGGSPNVLKRLVKNLKNKYHGLKVAYQFSPPFRQLRPEEDMAVVKDIQASKTKILFIGLGCPKQEKWMGTHVARLQTVMLGVGAAFDFHAGKFRQAPNLLQNNGLEWLFRLVNEPGRLWKRYLKYNPRFAAMAFMELARRRN